MWPDTRIKSSQIFTKISQKVAKAAFYIVPEDFKIAQKVDQYLEYV